MGRTFQLPKGVHIAPLPAPIYGTEGRRLPGGLCPRGMRNQWTNRAGDHLSKSKPKTYTLASERWYAIERDLRAGRRVYDSP